MPPLPWTPPAHNQHVAEVIIASGGDDPEVIIASATTPAPLFGRVDIAIPHQRVSRPSTPARFLDVQTGSKTMSGFSKSHVRVFMI